MPIPPPPEPIPISIPFFELLKVAGVGGIIAALITQFVGWWRESAKDKRTRKREGAYLAMRLAVILEGYAFRCGEVISINQLFRDSVGHACAPARRVPALDDYPADGDWKAIDGTLASRALSFRNEIHLSDMVMEFWEGENVEEIPNACDKEAGKRGYRAWTIATELRIFYGLPAINPKEMSWNIRETLKKYHDQAQRESQDLVVG